MSTDDISSAFRLPPEMLGERRITSKKIAKQRQHFAMLPMSWFPLDGASAHTLRVAWYLLYLHWKGEGAPIRLANGMLKEFGISRTAKWCALVHLEKRGLITIERRPKRSPIVTLHI
jgi:hypothetical protein